MKRDGANAPEADESMCKYVCTYLSASPCRHTHTHIDTHLTHTGLHTKQTQKKLEPNREKWVQSKRRPAQPNPSQPELADPKVDTMNPGRHRGLRSSPRPLAARKVDTMSPGRHRGLRSSLRLMQRPRINHLLRRLLSHRRLSPPKCQMPRLSDQQAATKSEGVSPAGSDGPGLLT